MQPVNIRVRAQDTLGGNCREDFISLVDKGQRFFEMDFALNKEDVLISGHDATAYQGRHIRDVVDPAGTMTRGGGTGVTFDEALRILPRGATLFVDLKDTHRGSRHAVDLALSRVIMHGRQHDVVLMAYIQEPGMFNDAIKAGVKCCLKRGASEDGRAEPYKEEEAMPWVDLAVRSGASYICFPGHPSHFPIFAKACQEASITLLVPIERPKYNWFIEEHLKSGTRHFITPYDDADITPQGASPAPKHT